MVYFGFFLRIWVDQWKVRRKQEKSAAEEVAAVEAAEAAQREAHVGRVEGAVGGVAIARNGKGEADGGKEAEAVAVKEAERRKERMERAREQAKREDRIYQLEGARGRIMYAKEEVDKKVRELEGRVEEEARTAGEGEMEGKVKA